MTREELDFIGSMNMCDEISNEAYKKIVYHCEGQEPCEDAISRQAVLDITWEEPSYTDALNVLTEVRDKVKELPSVNPQSCEDAISRQYLIDIATKDGAYDYVSAQEIANAPSVTPQPKIGHWIEDTNGTYTDNHDTWECSECGHAQILLEGTPKDNDYNYCPNCGAKMVEPQESEGKE